MDPLNYEFTRSYRFNNYEIYLYGQKNDIHTYNVQVCKRYINGTTYCTKDIYTLDEIDKLLKNVDN